MRPARLLSLLLSPLLLPLLGAPACGSDPLLSTVLVEVSSLPGMAVEIDAVVTNNGRSTTAAFYRDSTNMFIAKVPTTMAAMMMSPSVVQLALDLALGTTGTVKLNIGVKTGAVMQGEPTITHGACSSVDVSAGGLFKVSVPVQSPVPTCQ